MSPDLDSTVQTQMAVATFKLPLGRDCHGNKSMDGKPSRRRRVFVQTETGCVLGIELDSSDNAHTVKRRLQLALNVPTEESLLIYGDTVLKNDLSTVKNDCPLLLTRNSMHRSSSTPCLSPIGKDLQQGDQSGLVEILGCSDPITKQLVKDIVKAIEDGIDPIPVHSGLGGAYYFRNCTGDNVAIVKPTDEEPFAPNNPKGFVGKVLGQPGLKQSVRVGETGYREVAAYLLDYDHFANVPPTTLVKITHSIFNVNEEVYGNKHLNSKIASFQQFIPHDFDASDHGTSSFSVTAVHRIGILDIRILNTDRHAGNLLVRKIGRFGQVELVPIDHGLCLPESLEDPYFEWIHWPQASIPFSDDELEYIVSLDPVRDSEMLRMELPMIREACLRVLVLCTIFLKEAAAFGLCLAEIGEMMSREFQVQEEEPSELEDICMEARKLLDESDSWCFEGKAGNKDEFQFCMDSEEEADSTPKMVEISLNKLSNHSGFKSCNGQKPLSKLAESTEGGEAESETAKKPLKLEEYSGRVQGQVPAVSKLSGSLRNISLVKKSWQHQGAPPRESYSAGTWSGNSSVNEQLPGSASSVNLADMNEEEWVLFLDNFQKLLHPAFTNRKSASVGQSQRLGTSCKF
ncbi:phosphatidylinositol 4-kinase gamma 7-like [Cornus florida]|uniref:phosphatidylinositol 4-kinase gamma 7-like n=1 Tax=Cornus florida TaxID=4283 RepID=UPI0028986793|nr:phosphatidylinositol 4-kinase gamma 7-like [Cornus florida]XP_059639526.1 phosphatidylinositol 4-kinase gamma 7-like [Cornus florida]XP_059639527.1 phosphatidylinositol 4-kinase gamma 7-like [Cornus florida]